MEHNLTRARTFDRAGAGGGQHMHHGTITSGRIHRGGELYFRPWSASCRGLLGKRCCIVMICAVMEALAGAAQGASLNHACVYTVETERIRKRTELVQHSAYRGARIGAIALPSSKLI